MMSGDRSKAATFPGADPDRRATARMGRLLVASDLRQMTERQTGRLLEAAWRRFRVAYLLTPTAGIRLRRGGRRNAAEGGRIPSGDAERCVLERRRWLGRVVG